MKPTDLIHESWKPLIWLLNQDEILQLFNEVLSTSIYYPAKEQIFRVFQMPVTDIKVVILGYQPYLFKGVSNGLAYAVNQSINIPPSLENIRQELIQENLSNSHYTSFNWRTLEHWEQQGVFLLNTSLTQSGIIGEHSKYWQNFITKVIYFIAQNQPCIWLLWGKVMQSYIINMPKNKLFGVKGYTKETINQIPANPYINYILKASHPNEPSFLGNNHFHFVNKILERNSLKTINW